MEAASSRRIRTAAAGGRAAAAPAAFLGLSGGGGSWAGAVARLARGQEGTAWRVAAATFVTLGLTYGFWYAYSVFLVAFIREFGWSRSVVAGAFSLLVLVHGLSGPLIGWLVERFRPRAVIAVGGVVLAGSLLLGAQIGAVWQLYLVFGVLAALGMSAAGWVPSVVLIRAWFPARVGTALGAASAGIGVGIFALVPFAQLLIDGLGWRWALRALAVLIAAWIIPVTLFLVRSPAGSTPRRPRAAGEAAPAPARRHWTVRTAVRSWRFWGTSAVFFAGSAATQMPLVHQVAYLVDHGASALVGATVVGLVGIASIAGKAGWGALSDRISRELTYSLAFGCVAASVGLLALAGAYPRSVLPYGYAILIGVGYAVTAPLTPAIASDLFGGPRFARIFGLLQVTSSLGGALGAWIAGRIFDATGSYGLALPMAAGMALLAPGLLWFVAPRRPNPPPLG
jgi:MFS family permease